MLDITFKEMYCPIIASNKGIHLWFTGMWVERGNIYKCKNKGLSRLKQMALSDTDVFTGYKLLNQAVSLLLLWCLAANLSSTTSLCPYGQGQDCILHKGNKVTLSQ